MLAIAMSACAAFGESGGGASPSDGPGAIDAGAGGDGGANASSDAASAEGGAAAAPFCPQTGAFFCTDFDDETLGLTPPWDEKYSTGAAVIELTTAQFVSPRRSLVARTTATAMGATVIKRVSGNVFRIVFETYIEKRGDNAYVITFGGGKNGNEQVALGTFEDDHSSLMEAFVGTDGGFVYKGMNVNPVLVGTWTHVDFAVDLQKRTATATVGRGTPVSYMLQGEWAVPGGVFTIGLPNAGAATVYFDNVAVYAQ